MAKYKIEIEIDDELIKDSYRYAPEDVGEIMKDLFMIECNRKTDFWFKTKKGEFKSKGQVTRILNKINDENI
jgi:hypothetical protein